MRLEEEGGLARELKALRTGWRLGMHDSDWESLLSLAHRYGWRPSEGADHYLLLEGRGVVSPSEARALAGALEEALLDLPPERRRWFRPTVGALGGFIDETSRPGRGRIMSATSPGDAAGSSRRWRGCADRAPWRSVPYETGELLRTPLLTNLQLPRIPKRRSSA